MIHVATGGGVPFPASFGRALPGNTVYAFSFECQSREGVPRNRGLVVYLNYCNIKDQDGTLSREFVIALRDAFSIHSFVETGTHVGNTLAGLCNDFDRLHSIELSENYFVRASARFARQSNIQLIKADSATGLRTVLGSLPAERALFWLDAHFSGGDTARGETNTPVQSELSTILDYPERSDIILIDDLRYFWQVRPGFLQHGALGGYPSVLDVVALINSGNIKYDCFVLSDALLAIPSSLQGRYTASQLLKALTRSRIGVAHMELLNEVEDIISSADGQELSALSAIPDYLAGQSEYGLAGHYYYWRALVRLARGESASAAADAIHAAKCGVVPVGSLLARFIPKRKRL